MKFRAKPVAFLALAVAIALSAKALYDSKHFDYTPSKYTTIQTQIEHEGLEADKSRTLGALTALMLLADGKLDAGEQAFVDKLSQDPKATLTPCVKPGSVEEGELVGIDPAKVTQGYQSFTQLLGEFTRMPGVELEMEDVAYLVGGLVAAPNSTLNPKLAVTLIKAASGPMSCAPSDTGLQIGQGQK
ncbi:hypothetical protein [Pseudomonas serbica]|jgi:hypothetical protein|uniref:hypothetical protein n=1 Tax=Pseudomonas serbica TaxID=2965074 RepID=UPI00237B3370|nr:hypothetical protein [Pseudomonas serbica]